MILDTNFLIDLLNKKSDASKKLIELSESGIDCSIASPTIFELFSGISSLKKTEDEKNNAVMLISEQTIHELGRDSAKIGGIVHGNLIKRGQTIGAVDCMIAGIALTNKKAILTNDSHFDRIEGLEVQKY